MTMKARQGRGRLNGFEQLPADCDPLIAEAATALQDRERTQMEIYVQFFDGCQKLMAESHGELRFDIPSKSAFNRYSIRLATMTRRLEETREIAATIAERFDAEASDDLTLIAAEAIKTLVWEVLTAAGESGIDPKGAVNLANALKAATQAQGVSTARRLKVEKEFAGKVDDAVETVARAKGLSAETAEEIKSKILGVRG
jgi:Skp family chaperone for outer membrane proteins